jgi:cell division protein FtsI/penicillin-binding protein 2
MKIFYLESPVCLKLKWMNPEESSQLVTLNIPPVPGKDIYLTIDESVQFIVERELAKVVKEFKAAGGTVIVYDPT